MKVDQIAGLKALVDAGRLRIAGHVAARPATIDELVEELGLRRADVVRQVGLMRSAATDGGADVRSPGSLPVAERRETAHRAEGPPPP